MTTIEVNGKKIYLKVSPYNAKKSYGYYNDILYKAFASIGIENKYIHVTFGGARGYAMDAWAKVEWHVNGQDFEYKCTSQPADVDNLAAIAQIIEIDCRAIRRGLKSFGMVMNQFKIGFDPDAPKIQTPREVMGLASNMNDLDYITFRYKKLAKERHPDSEGGGSESFKQLIEAYNTLKEELK